MSYDAAIYLYDTAGCQNDAAGCQNDAAKPHFEGSQDTWMHGHSFTQFIFAICK